MATVKLQGIYISIHAPAKGATVLMPLFPLIGSISIHAPAKGATAAISTPSLDASISIHAPAKGATGDVFEICIA